MNHITKRINLLRVVQRGLDRSHPEFCEQSIDDLALSLNEAIESVSKLEQEFDALEYRVATVKSIAIDALVMLQEQDGDKETISVLSELIETLDVAEG